MDERTFSDARYMRQALELALRGAGHVAPNPLVGCVLVKDGIIVGQGWHARYGDKHAERAALDDCLHNGIDPAGAAAYVTLTPCAHVGKQPPCTDALVRAGIARVVIGSDDPHVQAAARSVELLRGARIRVDTGVLKEECDAVNAPYFHFITTHTPYVVLKYAMTLDGRVACRTGLSRWVSGEESRAHAHATRNRLTAIMAGIGTVIADDPLLTCRMPGGRDPIRIVCDSRLRIPLRSKIVQTARDVRTIVACVHADTTTRLTLESAGCIVVEVPGDGEGKLDLRALMNMLGAADIDSILLEGGPALAGSMLDARLVHAVQIYIAPKLFGGQKAPAPIGGLGVRSPQEALQLCDVRRSFLGSDLLVEGKVAR